MISKVACSTISSCLSSFCLCLRHTPVNAMQFHMKTILLSLLLTFTISIHAAPERPNIILIFMDDLGWADIGSFGATAYATPHLDRMAAEGRRFTDFYAAQAVCSASRAALLTGCYPNRIGISGALGPRSTHGLHDAEITLAELCKQQQYATAIFGKWHIGHHKKFLPLQHGFDEFFGIPYSNDMWPHHPGVRHLPMEKRLQQWPHLPLFEGNKIINSEVDDQVQEQLTSDITQRSLNFIERNKNRPFFLYIAHPMVHVPLYTSASFKDKSGAGPFGDVMMEIDDSVGQLLRALKHHGIDENTLMIFTSDNGPWLSYGDHAGSAAPLREGKGTSWEGGVRVPTLMRWPGKIPAGTTCSIPAMTIDILPTVAHLIGASLPEHPIDGKNIWPIIAGTPNATSPHEAYFFYYGTNNLEAMRMGPWKLHFPRTYRTMDGKPGGSGGIPNAYVNKKNGLELYDLATDMGERVNVADQFPEVLKTMQHLADQMRKKLGDDFTQSKPTQARKPGKL